MTELISITECVKILRKYGDRDKAADIQLVRYFETDKELVVKIMYKGCDLRCNIDKLSFVDNEVPNASSLEEFIKYYLSPLPPDYLMRIEGEEEEEEKEVKLNLKISQD